MHSDELQRATVRGLHRIAPYRKPRLTTVLHAIPRSSAPYAHATVTTLWAPRFAFLSSIAGWTLCDRGGTVEGHGELPGVAGCRRRRRFADRRRPGVPGLTGSGVHPKNRSCKSMFFLTTGHVSLFLTQENDLEIQQHQCSNTVSFYYKGSKRSR